MKESVVANGLGPSGSKRSTSCQPLSDAADTVFLSVPHRLLAIALRRGLLKSYRTVDELFEGNTRQIAVKDEHLDSPILLGAKLRLRGRE